MTIFFSAERGFLDDRIHPEIPADAVRITTAEHRALLEAQTAGKAIQAGTDGRPRALVPPVPSLETRRALLITAVKREAERRILAIAPIWRQLNDIRDGGLSYDACARIAAIDEVRSASNALEAAIATMSARKLAKLNVADSSHWPSKGSNHED